MTNQKHSITNYFKFVSNIVVYNDGKKSLYFKGDDKFELIFFELEKATQNAHDMPAFAVSLDNEIIKEKESGLWLELMFDKTQTFNEMPFDALLFKIEENNSGLNLIRKHNGKYEGRCFYLNLNENLNNLLKTTLKMS